MAGLKGLGTAHIQQHKVRIAHRLNLGQQTHGGKTALLIALAEVRLVGIQTRVARRLAKSSEAGLTQERRTLFRLRPLMRAMALID